MVRSLDELPATERKGTKAESAGEAPLGALGAGSDFSPFLDYAGIPSIDVGFGGDYGVYHSLYDDFYWMKHFGDPTFAYHAALARILGMLALRLDEADILPFDYSAYASEISRIQGDLAARAAQEGTQPGSLKPVAQASAQLSASALRASLSLRSVRAASLDPVRAKELNRALVSVEQELLAQEGLTGRPWFKHTMYAPGSYAGYAAETMPGVSESLDRKDAATLRVEADALAAALRRAATRLDEVSQLARGGESYPIEGH